MSQKKYGWFFVFIGLLFCLGLFAQADKPVDPVNWRELAPFLIDFPGWEAEGKATGASVSMGAYKVSNAKRSYSSNSSDLEIEIIDGAFNQMVYAAFNMAITYEVDTSDEYHKKVNISGFPGYETYEYDDEDGEIVLLVGDRFLIQIEGDDIEDNSSLVAVANALDLKGLAQLAK